MNNKILLAVGALVIIGIVAFVLMRGSANSPLSGGNIIGGKMSMKSLLGRNISQECTFSSTENGSDTSGTVYVASGKMRGDFNSTINGKREVNHMIVTDNTSYVWGDSMAQGIKMSLADTTKQENNNNNVDVNKEADYSCKSWSADNNKFTLPAGISFSDMNAMMNGALDKGMMDKKPAGSAPSGGTDIKAMQCGACDS